MNTGHTLQNDCVDSPLCFGEYGKNTKRETLELACILLLWGWLWNNLLRRRGKEHHGLYKANDRKKLSLCLNFDLSKDSSLENL